MIEDVNGRLFCSIERIDLVRRYENTEGKVTWYAYLIGSTRDMEISEESANKIFNYWKKKAVTNV